MSIDIFQKPLKSWLSADWNHRLLNDYEIITDTIQIHRTTFQLKLNSTLTFSSLDPRAAHKNAPIKVS
jgi:hypothetical protein